MPLYKFTLKTVTVATYFAEADNANDIKLWQVDGDDNPKNIEIGSSIESTVDSTIESMEEVTLTPVSV